MQNEMHITPETMLKVDKLTKKFSGLKAVDNVTFSVRKNSITGIIGSNGAGKTTVFNMISGMLAPTSGQIFYQGENITGNKPYTYTSKGIARTFQIMKPLRNMSILDNVISGTLFGRKNFSKATEAKEFALEILNFTGLYPQKDLFPGEVGTSYKKRLELARALATDPELLLLDEVMAGLNPTETDDAVKLIRKINENGITILLIEHVMRAVSHLCEKVIMMHHGEKIIEGSPEVVMNDPYVIEVYLGKGVGCNE
ncbi:MAG: ABC transporter ATP-binding protein [Spirochaetia bacterium]|jgi:branched-chain amino acid transport system ATP-binding protein|nr:ABC transporter ATP-binding protein [Spirochaetia bacterium]